MEMAAVLHQTGYFGWECSVAMVRKELEGLCDYELHAIAEDERRLAHLTLPTDTLFDSCKCQRLRVLLPQLLAEGHRVLIFSMWTRVLDILGAMLERVLHVPYLRLDGQTPVAERQELIDQYNTPNAEVSIFLLSTRAGGLGINLTSADTVILHDPDWNPSMDAQAIDRCHRIGQSKPVTVYRLVAEGTVDERIYQRALGKREKTEALLENGGLDDEEGGDLGGEGVGGGKEISRIVQSEFLAYQEARERAKQARAAEEEETSDSTFDSSEDEADREGEEHENEPVQYVGSRNGPTETNGDITKRSTPQRRYSSVLEDIVSEEGDEDDGQDV
jgi:SNF2 family DNA or RNA helicase